MQLVRIADVLHIDGNRTFELLKSDLSEDQVRRLAYKDLAELLTSHTLEKLRGEHEESAGP